MSAVYDLNTNVGKVRFLIPDTDTDNAELQDEEISYFLSDVGNNVKAAAAAACRWLARKYAQKVTFTADGLTARYGDRATAYAARAEELARDLQGGLSTVPMNRDDGFAEEADSSQYQTQRKYVYL